MNTIKKIGLAVGVTLMMGTGPALAEGDPANGENVYKRCATCHGRTIEEGKHGAVGPSLYGVIDRQAGTVEGWNRYTDINKAAGEAGLVWTEENIVEYLADPQAFLEGYLAEAGADASGRTRMAFKLPDEQDRMDVVAYIKQQSGE